MSKELLFSVTSKDCRWDYYRPTGNGGQKMQKTNSACRCTHLASGAVGTSQDERSQIQNKRLAFQRMAETKEFKAWHKIETARRLGKYVGLDQEVDRLMQPKYLRVEVQNENGTWRKEDEAG